MTGGHPYDEAAFRAMLASFAAFDITERQHPGAAAWYELSSLAHFAALVFYDFAQTRTTAPPAALQQALAQGIGAVYLHHALCNYPDWPAYPQMVGGFWEAQPFTIAGQVYGPSEAIVTPHLEVKVAAQEHPVTAGVHDFVLDDEYYHGYYVDPTVTPLLTMHLHEQEHVIGWAHTYGKGRVVYLQPGHGPSTYGHPFYRRLVEQAIRFVARSKAVR